MHQPRPATRDDDLGRPRPVCFRGWHFICPGLPSEPPCGRVVERLFLPLAPVTLLAHAIELGLAPRAARPLPWPHPFAPACHHCHRVRYFSLVTRSGWNLFVHHISAGLLEGRDVPIPTDLIIKRKRAIRPQRPRPTPRRDRVHELLLTTLTTDQIAARLGVKPSAVDAHAKNLYRAHNVRSRRELVERTAPKIPLRNAEGACLIGVQPIKRGGGVGRRRHDDTATPSPSHCAVPREQQPPHRIPP